MLILNAKTNYQFSYEYQNMIEQQKKDESFEELNESEVYVNSIDQLRKLVHMCNIMSEKTNHNK